MEPSTSETKPVTLSAAQEVQNLQSLNKALEERLQAYANTLNMYEKIIKKLVG